MAGAREPITVEVDDAVLRAALKRLIARVRRPTGALLEAGEVLTTSTKERFGSQTDPRGQRWAENSPVTLARKESAHILTQDGFLGDTIRYQLTADGLGVEVGSDRKYAAMQQFGGTRAEHPQLWGDIPPRAFLGLSDADRDAVLEIFMDDLLDSLAD